MENEGNTPLGLFFRKKWVRIVLVIDAVVVLVIVIMLIIDSMKTAVLELNIVPLDTQISVNGSTSYSNGKYRMFPGVYEVELSYPGMESKKITVDLSHKDVALISTFLSGNDDFYHYRLRQPIIIRLLIMISLRRVLLRTFREIIIFLQLSCRLPIRNMAMMAK